MRTQAGPIEGGRSRYELMLFSEVENENRLVVVLNVVFADANSGCSHRGGRCRYELMLFSGVGIIILNVVLADANSGCSHRGGRCRYELMLFSGVEDW
jgi:hypothetical protein